MYTNILVPYDKSEHAQHALQAAIEQGKGDKPAMVTVLTVTDLLDFDDATFEVAARMAGVPPMTDEQTTQARESYFGETRKEIQAEVERVVAEVPANVTVEVAITGGHPQEAICKKAKGMKADCIVMGCRGLGALRGAIGSVSYAVLRTVSIPVLIVK